MSARRKLAAATALLALAAAAIAIVLVTGGDDESAPAGQGQTQGQAQAREEIAARVAAGELDPDQAEELLRERSEVRETPREQAARKTAEGVYDLLAEEQGDEDSTDLDGAAFCQAMSSQARRQTVRYVRRSAGIAREWDCPSAARQLVLRAKRQGNFEAVKEAEVIGVNAEGDRATATVRFGTGAASSVSLVREGGEWRLASPPGGGE